MKNILVFIIGVISLLYLLNIDVGIIELIRGNISFADNLDESDAAALLFMCLCYFGLDITKILNRSFKTSKSES